MRQLVETIKKLRAAGYPPIFIYMYDETWHFIDRMFEAVQPVLGHNVVLEPSIYAWALQNRRNDSDAYIGEAFSLPHRDYEFGESWENGRITLLTIWMPFTDATLENGCMFMLPREFDEYFDTPQHGNHMRSARPGAPIDDARRKRRRDEDDADGAAKIRHSPFEDHELRLKFDIGAARALPGAAGTFFSWAGNTVHWGSHSMRRAPEPRMSMALVFKRAHMRRTHLQEELPPLSRAQMRVACMDMSLRLRLIAKGISLFRWWWGGALPERMLNPVLLADLRTAFTLAYNATGGDIMRHVLPEGVRE
ncbi:MAG: hypothetical protein EOO65_03100 [Methanosarcinales archaeon]|nr:MAG: hypothetical protein EOO65_03100 [Methanosarcinales archaeon]